MLSDYSTIHDNTRNGECSQCGECCGDILPLSHKEIEEIRRYVRRNHIAEEKHCPPTVEPIGDFTCPFRNEMAKKCNIYEIRPQVCRAFLCSRASIHGASLTEEDRKLISTKRITISMRKTFFGGKKK